MARELNASLVAVNAAQTYAEYVKALTTSNGSFSADKYIAGVAAVSQSHSSTSAHYSPVPLTENFTAASPMDFLNYSSYPKMIKAVRKREPKIASNPYEIPARKSKKKPSTDELNELMCRREDKKRAMETEREQRTTKILKFTEVKKEPEDISYADELQNAVATILYDPDENLVKPWDF